MPPGGVRTLRFTLRTADHWQGCRSEYWASRSLQVRVGAFTRTKDVDVNRMVMELRSAGHGC
ncbi:hypothetical protein SAMN05443575_3905 [Jatrophihabitans endophyticus]|uniref:Uncharacterized protein n=2 Tax=Jatrophihabitans endophyticus TaxID=1206085 RepID=A0A1M5T5F1_9ACTN|nr:hypothetical protein SAMN05443575_3905 [Jatrophihabitans endophyticus]